MTQRYHRRNISFCKTQQTTRTSIPDHAVVSHTKGCLIPTKTLEIENFYFYKPTMGETTPALQCSAPVGALRAPTSGCAACAPCTRACTLCLLCATRQLLAKPLGLGTTRRRTCMHDFSATTHIFVEISTREAPRASSTHRGGRGLSADCKCR